MAEKTIRDSIGRILRTGVAAGILFSTATEANAVMYVPPALRDQIMAQAKAVNEAAAKSGPRVSKPVDSRNVEVVRLVGSGEYDKAMELARRIGKAGVAQSIHAMAASKPDLGGSSAEAELKLKPNLLDYTLISTMAGFLAFEWGRVFERRKERMALHGNVAHAHHA